MHPCAGMSPLTRLFGPLPSLLVCCLGCAPATSQQVATPAQRVPALTQAATEFSVPPRPTATSAEQDPFLDGTLAVVLRRELDHATDLGVQRVEVRVQDGVATLRGEVATWDDA